MGGIPAMKYMTLAAGADTTGATLWLEPDRVRNWAMTVKTGGTLTGAFKFFRSNDPRARPDHPERASAEWTECTADVDGISDPAGGAVEFVATMVDFGSAFLRMDYDHDASTGTVDAWFSGH